MSSKYEAQILNYLNKVMNEKVMLLKSFSFNYNLILVNVLV